MSQAENNAEIEALLGRTIYRPSGELALGRRFESDEAYKAFLADSFQRPEVFWSKLIDERHWREQPKGVGGVKGWFPGGSLNLAEACLAPSDRAPLAGPVFCRVGPGQGETSCLSRAEAIARVDAIEGRIAKFSLTPGDRVFLALPGREMMLAAILACLRRGLVCVPQNPRYPAERLRRRFVAAGCKAEILAPNVPSAAPEASEGSVAQLVLGPGWEHGPGIGVPPVSVEPMHPAFVLADSTGQLFTLPTAGFLAQAINSYRHLLDGHGEADSIWLLTPPHHASSLSTTLAALAEGGQVGVLPEEACSKGDALLSSLTTLRPRKLLVNVKLLLRAVASIFEQKRRPRIQGPELLIVEGEVLEPRIYRALHEDVFDGKTHIVQVLSRPEGGGFVAGPHPAVSPVREASVTYPAPGLDLAVVNSRYEEVPSYHGGLMAIRRPFPGLALELQQVEPPVPLEVRARVDADGRLWTIGEVRVGKRRARRVATRELEAAFADLEGVEQVVVIRSRDEEEQVRTTAFVKPEPGATVDIDVLKRVVEDRFSPDSMPDAFYMVNDLPYSRSGKLLRSALKRIASGEPLEPDHIASVTEPRILSEISLELRQS